MYRQILIATDGSDMARHASESGFALAKATGARVHAVFVIDTRTLAGASPPLHESIAPRYASLLCALRESGEHILQDLADEGKKQDLEVTTEVVQGTPAAGILEAAARRGADLLVMGTHGRSAVGALLLGSTAMAVLHGARVPVLVVR